MEQQIEPLKPDPEACAVDPLEFEREFVLGIVVEEVVEVYEYPGKKRDCGAAERPEVSPYEGADDARCYDVR